MSFFASDDLWEIHPGDCIPHMTEEMPAQCIDLAVFSPPFPALYAYTGEQCDLGNSENLRAEGRLHFKFFFAGLARILKPGRVAIVHVMQIPRLKRSGEVGLHDFRGLLIRLGERAGLVYEYDWLVPKNPQALRNGSRVLTPNGWTPIESLVIGSEVIGSDGKPTKVVGIHPQGVRQTYRVRTSDGGSVECDGRHLWTVKTKRSLKTDGTSVTLTTDDMSARGLFSPSGVARFYLPILHEPAALAGNEPLPIHPYTMGVLLGDGMLSSRGTVGVCTQRGIVDMMPLPPGHSVRMLPKSEKGNDVASWHILGNGWHKNDVVESIRCLGLSGLRAWEKFIPTPYLFADVQSRRELLAGLLDTDGGNKVKGGIKYHTTSPRLAADVRFLVESLGGLCTVIRRNGGAYNHNGERKAGRDIYELTPRLRDGICPFRYRQKSEAWKPAVKNMLRSIVSIEPTGEHPCTCITVEAADGLFVTENCIVTHNSQAIRTKSRELQFAGLETDRARSRGALGDYLIKFRAPGENAVPVLSEGQVNRNDWIALAEAAWTGIKETDTLNVQGTKGEHDTRHICPLQLGVIDRVVRLYSNPGEIVFSPFAGIGSELYVAVKKGRRGYGCEIKPEYRDVAHANLRRAEDLCKQEEGLLFA